MQNPPPDQPRLRPVEALEDAAAGRILLRDPTQLAAGLLVVGRRELALLALLDGSRATLQIQADYARLCGEIIASWELRELLEHLGSAGFLAGAPFEEYYAGLAREYGEAPARPLRRDGGGTPASTR